MAKKFTCTCTKGYHYSTGAVDNCEDKAPSTVPSPSSNGAKYRTREEWFHKAAELIRHLFTDVGVDYPSQFRITSSLPRAKGNTGVCFGVSVSGDATWEIMISLVRENFSELSLLETLAHELIHASVGIEHGHKGEFKRVALGIGLMGKMTATQPGPYFIDQTTGALEELGPFPGAGLNLSNVKKAKTYLLKVVCEFCGYNARVTAKWINDVGAPICPCNHEPMST